MQLKKGEGSCCVVTEYERTEINSDECVDSVGWRQWDVVHWDAAEICLLLNWLMIFKNQLLLVILKFSIYFAF